MSDMTFLLIIIIMLIQKDNHENLLIKVNSFLNIFHLFNLHIFKHANADLSLGPFLQ